MEGSAVTNAEVGLTQLPDALGVLVELDGGKPLAELTATVNSVCDDSDSRGRQSVVVLRLTASDLERREWPGDVRIQDVNRWERAIRRLERLPTVNIAVAQGICGGLALDLLLATDFRIGAPDLRLMLPVNDGHLWPGMSIYRLVQHLGIAKARQIVLWDTDITLEKATQLGLIDQVSDDLTEAAHTAAVLTGRVSGPELTIRRQLLLEATSVEYEEALGTHLAACDRELRRLRAGSGTFRSTEHGS